MFVKGGKRTYREFGRGGMEIHVSIKERKVFVERESELPLCLGKKTKGTVCSKRTRKKVRSKSPFVCEKETCISQTLKSHSIHAQTHVGTNRNTLTTEMVQRKSLHAASTLPICFLYSISTFTLWGIKGMKNLREILLT